MMPGNAASRWDAEESGCESGERRTQPRLQCTGTAKVHLFPARIRCDGSLVNMSLGGCCVEVKEPIEEPLGSRVEVYLRVMGMTVQVAGVLCHVRDQVCAGIQFTGVSCRKAEQINELIEELLVETV